MANYKKKTGKPYLLTTKEHEVMMNLWALKKGGFTNQILELFPEDNRPAYTTLATFLKILTTKGFVRSRKHGSMLFFTPKITRMDYCQRVLKNALEDYFNGDLQAMIQYVSNDILKPAPEAAE